MAIRTVNHLKKQQNEIKIQTEQHGPLKLQVQEVGSGF